MSDSSLRVNEQRILSENPLPFAKNQRRIFRRGTIRAKQISGAGLPGKELSRQRILRRELSTSRNSFLQYFGKEVEYYIRQAVRLY
jgi:hypothetical protein